MTFNQSIPIAKQLAEKSLEKGFDVEAFLVLCEINKIQQATESKDEDLVPDSCVDECINTMLNLFVSYYNNKSVKTISPLLQCMRQIFSELYYSCETEDERIVFREFFEGCQYIK